MNTTKGEWYKQGDSVYAKQEGDSMVHCNDRLIAIVYPVSSNKELDIECTANALLLSASKDLLEACIEFVRKCDCGEARSKKSYSEMKKAILKATGK